MLLSSSLSKMKLFSPRTTVRGAAGEERGVEFHMFPHPTLLHTAASHNHPTLLHTAASHNLVSGTAG